MRVDRTRSPLSVELPHRGRDGSRPRRRRANR